MKANYIRSIAESFRLDGVEDCDEVFVAVCTEVDQRQVKTHERPQLVIRRLHRATTRHSNSSYCHNSSKQFQHSNESTSPFTNNTRKILHHMTRRSVIFGAVACCL